MNIEKLKNMTITSINELIEQQQARIEELKKASEWISVGIQKKALEKIFKYAEEPKGESKTQRIKRLKCIAEKALFRTLPKPPEDYKCSRCSLKINKDDDELCVDCLIEIQEIDNPKPPEGKS